MLECSQDPLMYDSFFGDASMRQVKLNDLDNYDLFALNLPCEGCEEICDDCPDVPCEGCDTVCDDCPEKENS